MTADAPHDTDEVPRTDMTTESNIRRNDRTAVVAGAAAGATLAGVLAIPRLGADALWLDEAYSLGVANQFGEGVQGSGGTMVGYYALLWVWTRFGDSPAWLRLFSTLLAMGAMIPVAAVGRRIGGRRLAVLAPLLLGGAYMFQTAALEARAYTLEILLVSTCWYLLIRAIQAGIDTAETRRFWVALTVLAPVGVAVHGLFVLFVAAMLLAGLLSPEPRRCVHKMVPMVATTVVAVVLLVLLGLGQTGNWVVPTQFEYAKLTLYHYLGGSVVLRSVSAVAFLGLSTWIVIGRVRLRRGAAVSADGRSGTCTPLIYWLTTIPLVWFVVPPTSLLAISLVRPGFVDRYLVAITPAVALAVGLGLCRTVDWSARRMHLSRMVATAVIAVVGTGLVVGWASVGQQNLDNRATAEWDEAASTIAENARPGDGLLLYGDLSRPPFEAAWARVPHRSVPEVLSMPRQLGEVQRYDEFAPRDGVTQERLLAHERIWTVNVGQFEMESVFYELSGPLPEDFDLARSWHFDGRKGPITIRLYVRKNSVD